MLQSRIIPCLLIKDGGLVKTVKFKDPRYVGDPINAVRIFNEKEVDELVFLDISATPAGRGPDLAAIEAIANEAFMPMGYGGGIASVEDIRQIFKIGIEKAVINTRAVLDPALVRAAADAFGSQSVVVSIDVRRKFFGGYEVVTHGGRIGSGLDPVAHAEAMQAQGAGELVVCSVERDGTMGGYDLALTRSIAMAVDIPVVALGGAGTPDHLRAAVREGQASAAAAGSMFVFHGKHRAVLITYPDRLTLDRLFADTP